MKRTIITLAIISLVVFPLFSQNVTIPDANFKTALIEEGVDTNEDGEISTSEAEAITNLDVSGTSFSQKRNISDLTGIEAFTHLDSLDVSYNLLTSLDLSPNTSLIYLRCRTNLLVTLGIANNTALKELRCLVNNLTSLDLSNNTELKVLSCHSNNSMTSLNVTENTLLDTLFCQSCNLGSLDVSKNVNLLSLYCFLNKLTSLDVTKNTFLTELGADDNKLTVLDVTNNTALTELWCGSNELTTLDLRNNTLIGTVDKWYDDLDVSNMPTLGEVCVWESFPAGVDYNFEGSDNVCFQTDCNGNCDPIGIEESNFSEFTIYPNPTNNQLTIETDQPVHHSIEIISLSGQLIYRAEMEGNSQQIDMTPFSKGIYFVTVRSDAWVRTEKVVRY